jgi:outer membrane protein OmpA-like peptidoglycan-associated protein
LKKLIISLLFCLIISSFLFAGEGPGAFFIGGYVEGTKLFGENDEYNRSWGNGFGFTLGKYFTCKKVYAISISGGKNWIDTEHLNVQNPNNNLTYDYKVRTYLSPLLLNFRVNLMEPVSWTPYLQIGGGICQWDLKDITTDDAMFGGDDFEDYEAEITGVVAFVEGGFEFFLGQALGIQIGARVNQFADDYVDKSGYGYAPKHEDQGFYEIKLGFNLYLGGRCPEDAPPPPPPPIVPTDKDSDGDGIMDSKDKCPNDPEDFDGFEDTDGCPENDNDKDGILDVNDDCPNKPEDMDGFEDRDGCPDLDNDQDGILDTKDDCPNEAETMNGFKDTDGCPDKKPEILFEEDAPIVLDGVNFATGSSELLEGSKLVLNKVVQTLIDYPEMQLAISGHTDNRGAKEMNMRLSLARAKSVRQYLINQGVQPGRLTAEGFAFDRPIATNQTAEGRLKNRRIEFLRLK